MKWGNAFWINRHIRKNEEYHQRKMEHRGEVLLERIQSFRQAAAAAGMSVEGMDDDDLPGSNPLKAH